jgi:cyanoexosortase A
VLQQPKFWLFSLLSGLYTIYLTLVWRAENVSHMGISILFGMVVFLCLQEKQYQLKLGSTLWASLIGTFLILGVLGYGVTQPEGALLRLFPFVSGLGVGLLASGFRGLKQYSQELTVFFFWGVPSVIASRWFDISPITAGFSRLLLFYTGFNVSGENLIVRLPNGSIKVAYDCSGIDQMNYLLGLSVLCLILFPLKGWFNKILVLLVGLTLGFLINVIRVTMMVLLIVSNRETFNLWHTGQGSYLFASLEVLLLGIFYFWLLKRQNSPPPSASNGT